jgi:RES domain-containing protein
LVAGLEDCITRGLVRAWQGDVCRVSKLKYATVKKLVDGEGAKEWGGRWNPPGIAAVYFSLDEETALAEIKQRHRRGKVNLQNAWPRVFVGCRVRLERVLDLRTDDTVGTLGLTPARLFDEWQDQAGEEPITQAIGRLAREHGLDGLIVPSAAGVIHRGANLVAYPDRAPHGWVRIYNKEQLPTDAVAPP